MAIIKINNLKTIEKPLQFICKLFTTCISNANSYKDMIFPFFKINFVENTIEFIANAIIVSRNIIKTIKNMEKIFVRISAFVQLGNKNA